MNKGLLLLLVAAVFYCYAAGAEVLLVKAMNSDPVHVILPLGTALLLNGYWPLQLLMYFLVKSRAKNPRPLTASLVKGYMVIGVLAGLVSALRCACASLTPHPAGQTTKTLRPKDPGDQDPKTRQTKTRRP